MKKWRDNPFLKLCPDGVIHLGLSDGSTVVTKLETEELLDD